MAQENLETNFKDIACTFNMILNPLVYGLNEVDLFTRVRQRQKKLL